MTYTQLKKPNNTCGKFRKLAAGLAFVVPSLAFAAFGLTTSTDFYTVDTGAGLVFQVRRTDNGSNSQSPGDIASLVYNGAEYQNQSRGSQVNSGFDWLYQGVSSVSVSAEVIDTDYIKVTVQAGDLTHYYMARNGYAHIYMGDYFTSEPSQHNHVRYIMRLSSSLLPNGPTPSDIRNNTGAIESGDIFGLSNGETRSKHYSNQRLRDWTYFGATGNNVGMWFVRDNHEGGSGGPFYRSLLNQCDTDQELTYIVNYGQVQTEDFRPGVLNHYTFVANSGSAPTASIDTSWFANMGLSGYVAPSGRGRVTGVAINGRDTNFDYTVGFKNANAQYWTDARASDGYFNLTGMRPGTYTMTVYKNELEVDERQVSVTAGGTTILNSFTIANDPSSDTAIWRIGDWDGSPAEFLNGDKLTTMHPSDARMSDWDPSNFIIGYTGDSSFPAYMWKDINNDHIIYFKLSSSQLASGHTLRIGITVTKANGRPKISVNDWTSDDTSPSDQPTSRSLTTGSYRGNNDTYTFDIPASAWNTDPNAWNALTVTVISGSSPTGYLSPSYSVDCIDLLD